MLDLPVQQVRRFDLLNEGEEVLYVVKRLGALNRFDKIDIATVPVGHPSPTATWYGFLRDDTIRVMRPIPSPAD